MRRGFALATTARPPMASNGAQLANPFGPNAVLGEIDRTTTHSTTTGVSLQATNTDRLFGHDNRFVVGTSFDYSVTHFTRQRRARHHRSRFCRQRQRHFSRTFRLPVSRSARSTCAPPISTAGSMRSIRSTSPMPSRSPAAAGSMSPTSACRTRSAPRSTATIPSPASIRSIGGTYKITSELTAYAGYSEANRAPTPLELGCADPGLPASSPRSWSPIRR